MSSKCSIKTLQQIPNKIASFRNKLQTKNKSFSSLIWYYFLYIIILTQFIAFNKTFISRFRFNKYIFATCLLIQLLYLSGISIYIWQNIGRKNKDFAKKENWKETKTIWRRRRHSTIFQNENLLGCYHHNGFWWFLKEFYT